MPVPDEHSNVSDSVDEKLECKLCGCQSVVHEAYIAITSSKHGLQHICRTCAEYNNQVKSYPLNELFGIAAILALTYYLFDSLIRAVVVLLVFVAFRYLAIVMHELAHVLSARLVGVQVPALSVGGGVHSKVFKIGRTFLIVSAAPTEGLTVLSFTNKAHFRKKLGFIYAAGPLANLGMGVVSMYAVFAYEGSVPVPVSACLFLWGIINLFGGVRNLIPFSSTTAFAEIQSDGAQILRLRTMTDEEIEEIIAQNNYLLASLEYTYGDMEVALDILEADSRGEQDATYTMRMMRIAALINLGKNEKAISLSRHYLEDSELTPVDKAILQNNLACAIHRTGEQANMQEASLLSEEAFEILPMLMSVRGTRGCTLIETGRVEEGIALLSDPRFKSESCVDQANVHANLAIGLAKLNRISEAEASLHSARQLVTHNETLVKAEAAIRSANASQAVG